MTDNTMTFIQALVRLWDNKHRGYTMQEIALEAGWPLTDDQPEPSRYGLASVGAMTDGMVTYEWAPDPGGQPFNRLLFTPVLG